MRAAPILNLGSLNIDRVFRVERIARPGETIAGLSLAEFAGGKGANQSVALARAGAQVVHLGRIGPDGRWLLDKLAAEGIDTQAIRCGSEPTGQAIIQVDNAGENAIVVWPGANGLVCDDDIDTALAAMPAESWLLAQNETSGVEHAIRRAAARGMRIALNPAPCDARAREYPLELAHLLCVNETEGAALTGRSSTDEILAALTARLPDCEIVLTLGRAGAVYRRGAVEIRRAAWPVTVVDTTAAGDTFWGYFLARRVAGGGPEACLEAAVRAAACCVGQAGAMDSIPTSAAVAALA